MEITDRVDLFFFFAQPIHPHLPNIVYFSSRVHVHNQKKKKKKIPCRRHAVHAFLWNLNY